MIKIQEITTRKENLTFDCKSIQINPKALAVPIVAFAKCHRAYNIKGMELPKSNLQKP